MKCPPHLWKDGSCVRCKKRKPGPSKNRKGASSAAPSPASPSPAAASEASRVSASPAASAAQPAQPAQPSRAERFSRLFPAVTPTLPVATETTVGEECESGEEIGDRKGKRKVRVGRGWDWASKHLISLADAGGDLAIGALTDKEPMAAEPERRSDLQEEITHYGREKFPDVEVPPWLALAIVFLLFLLSKYLGAPVREEIAARRKATADAKARLFANAPIVATSAPDSVSDADTGKVIPLLQRDATAQGASAGNADDAPNGF
jgi:hypothetical protein